MYFCIKCNLLQKESSLTKVEKTQIYVYIHKYLEDGLTAQPFSKTTVVSSLVL